MLAAGNELTSTQDIDALTDLGLPVLVLYPESLDEVSADIELVGEALDAQAEAGRRHGRAWPRRSPRSRPPSPARMRRAPSTR